MVPFFCVAAGDLGDEHSAQQDEKYISRVADYRYATTDMQEPRQLSTGQAWPHRAAEWFKKSKQAKSKNPYVIKPVKPYRPAPAKKLNK